MRVKNQSINTSNRIFKGVMVPNGTAVCAIRGLNSIDTVDIAVTGCKDDIGIVGRNGKGGTINQITFNLCPDGPAVCALKELSVASTRPFKRPDGLRVRRMDSHAADVAAG